MAKAQVISIDVIFAVIVFLFILIYSFWMFDILNIKHEELEKDVLLKQRLDQAALMLFESEGTIVTSGVTGEFTPLDETDRIGLRSGWYIDEEKMDHLQLTNQSQYSLNSRLLGLVGEVEGWRLSYYQYGTNYGSLSTTPAYQTGREPGASQQVLVREYYGSDQDKEQVKLVLEVWS